VSRSDNTGVEGVKLLQNVVQCHPGLVLVLDDRRDMWHSCVDNLVKAHPFHYFHGFKESYNRNQPREMGFFFYERREREREREREKKRERERREL